MDYELLLNKHKFKKASIPLLNDKLEKIIDIINSIDTYDIVDLNFILLKEKCNLSKDIIEAFKNFIISYCLLKKQLSIENDKHIFIRTIIDDIIKKAVNQIDIIHKNTTNDDIKQIANCILEDSNKKTIKLNLIKS